MYRCAASRSGKVDRAAHVAALDDREVPQERTLAVLGAKLVRRWHGPTRLHSSGMLSHAVRDGDESAVRTQHAAKLRGAPDRGRARGRASRRRRAQSKIPSRNGRSWTSPTIASTPRASRQLDHPLRLVDRRPRARRAPASSARRARRGPGRPRGRAAARPRPPPRSATCARIGAGGRRCCAAIRAARPRLVRVLAADERRGRSGRSQIDDRLCRAAACPRPCRRARRSRSRRRRRTRPRGSARSRSCPCA